MPSAAAILRTLLATGILAMAVLALVYLHRRSLPLQERIAWILLACLLPLLGPFLVIVYQPGQAPRHRKLMRSSRSQDTRLD